MSARPIPSLHVISPTTPEDFSVFVDAATERPASSIAIHVRLHASAAQIQFAAYSTRERDPTGTLIINDRVDVAQLVCADGVQLGERSFSPNDARRLLGPEPLIGRSIHSVAGAMTAERAGADYLIAGHVYETSSKPGTPGRGVPWLAEVVQAVSVPVIAIGGITPDRLPAVLAAGAHGVAVASIAMQPNARSLIDELIHRIDRYRRKTGE